MNDSVLIKTKMVTIGTDIHLLVHATACADFDNKFERNAISPDFSGNHCVGRSVGRSIGPSVGPSVRPSVRLSHFAFFFAKWLTLKQLCFCTFSELVAVCSGSRHVRAIKHSKTGCHPNPEVVGTAPGLGQQSHRYSTRKLRCVCLP